MLLADKTLSSKLIVVLFEKLALEALSLLLALRLSVPPLKKEAIKGRLTPVINIETRLIVKSACVIRIQNALIV